MKKAEHIAEANLIAANSFGLTHFDQLPDTATVDEQIEALRADQRWTEAHANDVNRMFDTLISKLSKISRQQELD